jgi:hypothetical protein
MAVLLMNKFTSNAFVMHLSCKKYTSFTVMYQTRTMGLLLEDHGNSKQASKQTSKQASKQTNKQTNKQFM